jgi:hypothetical protein
MLKRAFSTVPRIVFRRPVPSDIDISQSIEPFNIATIAGDAAGHRSHRALCFWLSPAVFVWAAASTASLAAALFNVQLHVICGVCFARCVREESCGVCAGASPACAWILSHAYRDAWRAWAVCELCCAISLLCNLAVYEFEIFAGAKRRLPTCGRAHRLRSVAGCGLTDALPVCVFDRERWYPGR